MMPPPMAPPREPPINHFDIAYINPISKDEYDVQFFQEQKDLFIMSEEEKSAPWNIDFSALLEDRRLKTWSIRPIPPSTAESQMDLPPSMYPIPNQENALTLAQRWNFTDIMIEMMVYQRMLAGTIESLLAPGYHEVGRYSSAKIALNFKRTYREYWRLEAEDVEAIYQQARANRNPSFLLDATLGPGGEFDYLLPLVLHIRKGHFTIYQDPDTTQIPVRNGCLGWDTRGRLIRSLALRDEELFLELYPPRWTRNGISWRLWQEATMEAEDPLMPPEAPWRLSKHRYGEPLVLTAPLAEEPNLGG